MGISVPPMTANGNINAAALDCSVLVCRDTLAFHMA